MSHTEHTEYRGWDIAIRCMQKLGTVDDAGLQKRFTGSAHASLQEGINVKDWIDPRLQVISSSSNSSSSHSNCTEILLAEVKEVIDALKR